MSCTISNPTQITALTQSDNTPVSRTNGILRFNCVIGLPTSRQDRLKLPPSEGKRQYPGLNLLFYYKYALVEY